MVARMSLAPLQRKVRNLEAFMHLRQRTDAATLDTVRAAPKTLMTCPGLNPDAWQEQVL